MTDQQKEQWIPCPRPKVEDTLRWKEPLRAKPTKPRGLPDKIGEQMITAKLLKICDLMELQVINVERLSLMQGAEEGPARIKPDDIIRRKASSIAQGQCQKLSQEK